MQTLFNVKINWIVFLVFVFLLYIFFPGLSIYTFLAFVISFHQFLLLFYSIGKIMPIRYLIGMMMCLQMLLGPSFAYNGLDEYQYFTTRMQIPEEDYFSYVIPAVVCFLLGLHVTSNRLEGEVIDVERVAKFVDRSGMLPYILIGIGFVSSLVADLFGSEMAFVIYLLGVFKYIGGFMLILSSSQLKLIPLIFIYGAIIASSLVSAMFHDMLVWFIFLFMVIALKYKPSVSLKILATLIFISAAVIIQQTKEDYRMALGARYEETGIETFNKTYQNTKNDEEVVNMYSLSKNNIRINQGYIITTIMKNVPDRVPFAEGSELMQILESAFLPRFIAPNKLNAGDQAIFMKYTGLRLNKRTSMALSSVGDAYINFGTRGGAVMMFFIGLFFSEVLKLYGKFSKTYPLLILFTPLAYYYPIRPDCEFQTLLGHLVKSSFLLFVVFRYYKSVFKDYSSDNYEPKLAV